MERLVADIRAQTALEVELNVDGLDGTRLPSDVETAAFRITQEALANVVAHAQAHTARARIGLANGSITVDVIDDGCGFDPATKLGTLGLTGLCERAALVGGRCTIESTPGRGTRVRAAIPAKGRS